MTDYQVDAALAEGIRFIPIGIPGPLADAAILAIAAAWGTATIAAIGLLLPVATMRGLIPIFSILLVQSLWFTIPYALGHFQIETGLPVVDLGTRQGFFTYIAIAHAVQYLWITTYFARASVEWSGYGRYWLKAMLFGQTAAALPILLVTKSGVGNFSYDGGLLLLVVAFVNLHHFILDGAIWKLRASRIARVLVRADRDESQSNATSWPRRLAWTVAGAVFVVGVATHVDRHHVFPAALERQHTVAAQSALDRLALLGHDAGSDRLRLAILYADQSRSADAEREVQRSIELRPMPEGFGVLGKLKTRAGDWAAARSAFESGLALAPNDSRLLRGAGVAAYQLGDWSGAEVHLQSAVARRRKDPETTTLLRDARVRLRGGAGEDRPE